MIITVTQAALPVKWEGLVIWNATHLVPVPTWLQLLHPMTLSDILCPLISMRAPFSAKVKQKTYGLKIMINHLLWELPNNIRRSGTNSKHPPLLTPSWTMHLTPELVNVYSHKSHLLSRSLEPG